uniref:Uncharacterized protein n=1 Tax=viral metagenome TaxID=1070528 RepID=A0A6M3LSJ2_9ZZZZ
MQFKRQQVKGSAIIYLNEEECKELFESMNDVYNEIDYYINGAI